MRFALPTVLLLLIVLDAKAQTDTAAPAFPFWVKTTQAFTYTPGDWQSSVNTPEQVIGEEGVNYIVMAADGTQLKLPKAYSKTITAEEAAVLLLGERKTTYDNSLEWAKLQNKTIDDANKDIDEANKRLAEYDTALKASQAKVTEYEQHIMMLVAALKAQQQGGGHPKGSNQGLA